MLVSLIECGVACNIRAGDCSVFWINGDGVCELGNDEKFNCIHNTSHSLPEP